VPASSVPVAALPSSPAVASSLETLPSSGPVELPPPLPLPPPDPEQFVQLLPPPCGFLFGWLLLPEEDAPPELEPDEPGSIGSDAFAHPEIHGIVSKLTIPIVCAALAIFRGSLLTGEC
jgi:hypothetical protein